MHMHDKKNQLILVRVLRGYQTFFSLGTSLTALNKIFCKLTVSLLADTEPVQIQRRLIDLSKIEKRVRFLAPCGSRIVKFLIHYWFVRQTTNTKGKECGPNLSSHLWGGELRDDTKNGCVADYVERSMRQCLLFVVFNSQLCLQMFFVFKKPKKPKPLEITSERVLES